MKVRCIKCGQQLTNGEIEDDAEIDLQEATIIKDEPYCRDCLSDSAWLAESKVKNLLKHMDDAELYCLAYLGGCMWGDIYEEIIKEYE